MADTRKTFTLAHDGAADALQLSVDPSLPEPLGEQLAQSFEQALEKGAKTHSCFSQYGPEQYGSDSAVAKEALVTAIRQAHDTRVGNEGEPFPDRVIQHFQSILLDSGYDGDETVNEAYKVFGDPEDMAEALQSIADELGVADELGALMDADGYEEAEDWVRSKGEFAVICADDSTPESVIDRLEPIRMVYTPLEGGISIDSTLSFSGRAWVSAEGVVPDEHFVSLLQLVNVSGAHYIQAVKRLHDIDLLNEDECDLAEDWQAINDGFEPADPMRPMVMSPDELVTVVENSYTACVPTLAVNVPAKVLLEMDESRDLIVRGGQVGLHDFFNGAGYMTSAKSPIRVSADIKYWAEENNAVQSVYGMTNNAFDCKISVHEPSPQRHLDLSANMDP